MQAAAELGVSAPRRRFDVQWVVIGACVAVVLWLAAVPLGYLLWQSFFTPQTARVPAQFTLGNYVQAYSTLETVRLFLNSLQFAVQAMFF